MNAMNGKSSKGVMRFAAVLLAFAMVVTSVAVSPSMANAKKKVKKISITTPSTSTLVLKKGKTKKLKVTVSPKGASKAATYKSSNTKVAKVSKSGVVKALKKGTAKITVTSKSNKKKKDTIKIKVGTPVSKITLSGKKGHMESYTYTVTNVETGVQKEKVGYKQVEDKTYSFKKKKSASIDLKVNEWVTLKTNYTPSKASYKKVSYKSNKTSVATVNQSTGAVTARKVGTAKITVTTKDGSGKKAYVKIKVADAAPVPTVKLDALEEDNRAKVMMEDFESYAVGTTWKITKGESYKNSNCATATVVTDPADANNKLLKISYDGDTQAYDVAPIFTFDLTSGLQAKGYKADSALLGDFTGINFKTKVESKDTSDVTYKTIYGYFAKAGTIDENYYNATEQTSTGEYYKFKTGVNMVKGKDKEFVDAATQKKDNYKNFPQFYSTWVTDKACTPGYSETNGDPALKLAQRVVDMQLPYMKDQMSGLDLNTLDKFDMTLGSPYSGNYAAAGAFVNLYIDDIQLLYETETRGITGINFKNVNPLAAAPTTLGTGLERSLTPEFVPENTTQKKLSWHSSDETLATVDDAGKVTANNKGKTGDVTITATSVDNPAVSKSVTWTVYKAGTATEDKVFDLSTLTLLAKKPETGATDEQCKVSSNLDAVYDAAAGGIRIPYTDNNQSVVIDLGEEIDMSQWNTFQIMGKVPGQMEISFYDSSLDMRYAIPSAGKDNDYGATYATGNWWEMKAGATCPFFNGSNKFRLEDGAYNLGSVDLGEETLRFGWNKLAEGSADGKSTADFTKIRYIILKSNQAPAHPIGYVNDDADKTSKNNYLITGLSLSTKKYTENYSDLTTTELNEAMATKSIAKSDTPAYTSIEYGKTELGAAFTTFVSNSKRSSGVAYYIDTIKKDSQITTEDEVTTVDHDNAVDITDYRYVKVKFSTKVADAVSIAILADGNTWSSRVKLVSESEARTGERTVYFTLKDLPQDQLKAVDAVALVAGVADDTIKIDSFELCKYEPMGSSAGTGLDKDDTLYNKTAFIEHAN